MVNTADEGRIFQNNPDLTHDFFASKKDLSGCTHLVVVHVCRFGAKSAARWSRQAG
jgi:hypothetical protein